MKRIRVIAALIAALVVIAISLFVLFGGQANKNSSSKNAKTSTVVVAVNEIPAYTVITENMVKTKDYPESAATPNMFKSVDNVVGSVSLGLIASGEPITANHIRMGMGDGQPAGLGIEDGYRAMTVSVSDETGAAQLLKIGNNVDVIFVADVPGGTEAVMLLENIRVIAIGHVSSDAKSKTSAKASDGKSNNNNNNNNNSNKNSQNASSETTDQSNEKKEAQAAYTTVTMQVTPDDAVKLASAWGSGTIYLAPRAQSDSGTVGSIKVISTDLL